MSRLLPILAIVFSIALFFLYVRPTYSGEIAATRQKIASYDSALAAASRFQEKEAELTQARAQIPPESLRRLSDFLPDGVDNVQLILDLDALAARSGVTLSAFDVQNQSGGSSSSGSTSGPSAGSATAIGAPNTGLALDNGTPIDSIDLTFTATGSYSAFRAFLEGMETSLRPLDVVNLSVAESSTGVYTYSVTTRIYWLR